MMLRRIPKSVLMTPSLESEEVTAQTTDNKETTTEVVTTPEVTETVAETPVSEKTTSETEHSEAPQATTVAVATSTVVEQTVETPVVTTSEEETVKPQETQAVTTPVEETVVVDSQPTETVSEVTDTTVQQTEEVTTSNEGVKGALIGGAAGAFGPIGGAVAGHYAEKEIDKLKEKIENLEKENKDLRSGKSSASQEDEQTTTPATDETTSQTDTAAEVTEKIDAVVDSQVETDTQTTDQTTEQTEQQVAETPVETPPSSEQVAQVAVQAATDAVKEAGAAEGTTVVTVVIEPVVSTEENEELAVLSEQVQSDTEQATRVAVESEELAGEIDTLVESRDTLGKLNDVAANAVDNGGLSEDGAQALSVAVESIYTRIGLEGYNGIPSMEAFSSEFSKVNATSVAMEDIKEKMQAIGKSIVEGIKKMIEFLTEMFDKFLTANGRMLERAKKIAEAAKTYEAKVDATISSPSVYKNLAVGESIPDKKTLINGLGEMSKFIEGLASIASNEEFKKLNELYKKLMSNNIVERIKAVFKGEGNATEDYKKFMDEFNSYATNVDLMKFVKAISLSEANADRAINYGAIEKENTRLVASPVFPGNTIIYGHVHEFAEDGLAGLVSFGKASKRELAGDNKNLQVLSEQEITQLCSLAVKFIESVKRINDEIKESKAVLNAVSNLITVGISASYAGTSSGNIPNKLIKYFTAIVNMNRHISFGLFGSASAEGTRVFNAALDYCQLSLNAGTKTSETKKIA